MKYYLFCFCTLFFSAAFTQDLVFKKDVTYGKAIDWRGRVMELKLDVIHPTKAKKLPLIVNLHGGGFLYGLKEPDSGFCKRLAKANFVVANVEYRQGYDRSPDKFRAGIMQAVYRAVQDEAAALRYLVHYAKDYPIDTTLIFVVGGSAGGVTSLFFAYVSQSEWNAAAAPFISSLGSIDTSGNDFNDKFKIRGVVNLWGGISDTSFISPDEMKAVPILLFQSVDDEVIPYERASHPETIEQNILGSFDIAHRFKNNNACYNLHFVNGAKHGYGFSQNYVIGAISNFVNNIRKGKCKSEEIENKNTEIKWGFGEYVDRWDKDQSKWNTLMKLAYKGDTAKITSLLANGQNINSKNVEGWTPLKVAVKMGEIKMVEYLLQLKADPNLADIEGLNSLMEACLQNYYDIAEILLENGADPNLTNIYGWTALMGATTYGDIKLMELLLKYKADINTMRRTDGMTALGLAKFLRENQKVEFLINHGAK